MGIKTSLQLLSVTNLLHGIVAMILFYFIGEPVPPSDLPDLVPLFWILVTLLIADWGANVNFFVEMIQRHPEDRILKWSTLLFAALSLWFRIEASSYFILHDFVLADLTSIPIFIASSLFFGINLLIIARKSVASDLSKLLSIIGFMEIFLTGVSIIIIGADVYTSSIQFPFELVGLNMIKHTILPFVMAGVFLKWYGKLPYQS